MKSKTNPKKKTFVVKLTFPSEGLQYLCIFSGIESCLFYVKPQINFLRQLQNNNFLFNV